MGHAGQSDEGPDSCQLPSDYWTGCTVDDFGFGKNAGGRKNSNDGSVPLSVPARAIEGPPLSGMQYH